MFLNYLDGFQSLGMSRDGAVVIDGAADLRTERDRGAADALMEVFGEIGCTGKAELVRDLCGGVVAMGEKPFGFQDGAPFDEPLGVHTHCSLGGSGQRGWRVSQGPGVVSDPAGAGKVAFDRVAKPQERAGGVGPRSLGRLQVRQTQHESSEQVAQEILLDLKRTPLRCGECVSEVVGGFTERQTVW